MAAAHPTEPSGDPSRQSRKRGADRIEQMLDITDRQIDSARTGAISMQAVSDEAGVSRALVYAYFPDLPALLDAVLVRHVTALRERGIERLAAEGSASERVRAVSQIYLRYSAEHGGALEYVLRDPGIARQLDGTVAAFRARILRRLTRALRSELKLSAHEAMVFAQLLEAFPSEASRLVRDRQMSLEDAVEVSDRLLAASIESVRPVAD